MKKRNFTLVELLVVMAILVLLVAIVLPNTGGVNSQAYQAKVLSNISNLQKVVDQYMLENGKYPTAVAPKIGEPRLIDFSLLFPKYLKSVPDGKEYYWVDFTGKVWGSTVKSPDRIVKDNGYLKWEKEDEVMGYEIYEVKGNNLNLVGTVSSNKISMKKIQTLRPYNETKLIEHEIEEDHVLLISSVDVFGLSSAPVGINYENILTNISIEDPEINESTHYVVVKSLFVAEWLGVEKYEYKPEGTDILYEFATSDDGENYTEFTDDFHSLSNSKYLRVKITLIRTGQESPVLHGIRIIYKSVTEETIYYSDVEVENTVQTLENNKILITTPNAKVERIQPQQINSSISVSNISNGIKIPSNSSGEVSFVFDLGTSKNIENIVTGISKSVGTGVSVSYSTSTNGSSWSSPSSYPRYLPNGRYIKVTVNVDGNNSPVEIQHPIIVSTPDTINAINEILDSKEAPPLDPNEAPPVQWEEIRRSFVWTDSHIPVRWVGIKTLTDEPNNTRIRYEFSISHNGSDWTESVKDISLLPDSKHLRVTVIKEKIKDEEISNEPVLYELEVEYTLPDGSKGSKISVDNRDLLKHTLPSGIYQEWIVPYTGKYKIEVYAAKGGSAGKHCANSYGGTCSDGSAGTNGSYVYGDIELQEGDILYIYQGANGSSGGKWTDVPGSLGKYGKSGGGGGGGGSEVRLNSNTVDSRIISAMGGAGANGHSVHGSTFGSYSGSPGSGGNSSPESKGKNANRSTGGAGGGVNYISDLFTNHGIIANASISGKIVISRILE